MFRARAERIQDASRVVEDRPIPPGVQTKAPGSQGVSNEDMFSRLGIQVEKVTVPKKG
jgi:hypothetical protein